MVIPMLRYGGVLALCIENLPISGNVAIEPPVPTSTSPSISGFKIQYIMYPCLILMQTGFLREFHF